MVPILMRFLISNLLMVCIAPLLRGADTGVEIFEKKIRPTRAAKKSLELLKGTAVNCVLIESSVWSRDFSAAVSKQRFDVLGLIKPAKDALERAQRAKDLKLCGSPFAK